MNRIEDAYVYKRRALGKSFTSCNILHGYEDTMIVATTPPFQRSPLPLIAIEALGGSKAPYVGVPLEISKDQRSIDAVNYQYHYNLLVYGQASMPLLEFLKGSSISRNKTYREWSRSQLLPWGG